MFKLVKLEPWHLAEIDIQPRQKYFEEKCQDPAYRVALAEAGGVTAIVDNGAGQAPTIVGIAGIMEYDKGVGMAWAVLSTHFPKYAVQATREVRRYCAEQLATNYHRIEMQADTTFPQACRWALMLGFEFESVRKQGSAFRHDMNVYIKLREEA